MQIHMPVRDIITQIERKNSERSLCSSGPSSPVQLKRRQYPLPSPKTSLSMLIHKRAEHASGYFNQCNNTDDEQSDSELLRIDSLKRIDSNNVSMNYSQIIGSVESKFLDDSPMKMPFMNPDLDEKSINYSFFEAAKRQEQQLRNIPSGTFSLVDCPLRNNSIGINNSSNQQQGHDGQLSVFSERTSPSSSSYGSSGSRRHSSTGGDNDSLTFSECPNQTDISDLTDSSNHSKNHNQQQRQQQQKQESLKYIHHHCPSSSSIIFPDSSESTVFRGMSPSSPSSPSFTMFSSGASIVSANTNPTMGNRSIISTNSIYLQDKENAEKLREFLSKTSNRITEKLANQYANILIKNGVCSIEILKRRLVRNEDFLLDIGIDEDCSDDIIELLLSQSSLVSGGNKTLSSFGSKSKSAFSLNSKSKSRYGGKSMKSIYSFGASQFLPSSNNSVSSRSLSSSFSFYQHETSPTDIANLYTQVLNNTLDKHYVKKLTMLADEEENPYAQGFLMRVLATGLGGNEQNLPKATKIGKQLLQWFKDVIQQTETLLNNTHSIYCKYLLGVCYGEGLGVAKDAKEAFTWYKLSAEQGYDASQAMLGHCYFHGIGVVKDTVEALKWYKSAANQGYAPAQCNLGICYERGEGTHTRDPIEAVKWFQLSALQGNPVAQYNLAKCYESGIGLSKDSSAAVKYYHQSAEQGHAMAQYSLGLIYMNGYGNFAKNGNQAFHWFQQAAIQGYCKAQCYVGVCYEKGIGCDGHEESKPNPELAVKYYLMAAEQQDPVALYYLGLCYFNGVGVKQQDYSQALHYYQESAKLGYAPAQNNFGYCCYEGYGIPRKNYTAAITWYKKASEQNYAPAQYNLGHCYEKGYGVPKKQKEMIIWYRKAAEQGHNKAINALKKWSTKF
jgi:TPR repeat protein